MLGLLSTVIVFHMAVAVKAIPYGIAWGGKLHSDAEMYVFEIASILINLFLVLVLLMKAHLVKFRFAEKTTDIILWIFLAVFLLNTIGNLFAATNMERSFAVLSFAFAVLILAILKTKNEPSARK